MQSLDDRLQRPRPSTRKKGGLATKQAAAAPPAPLSLILELLCYAGIRTIDLGLDDVDTLMAATGTIALARRRHNL